MKRFCFIVCCLFMLACGAKAQYLFGYFSYDSVLKQMPEYKQERAKLDSLKMQLDAEMSRVEKDFNEKYEEFLDGQKDYPPIILQKRQLELQDAMDRNIEFKQKARNAYVQAERDVEDLLRMKINDAVKQVGKELQCAFILNNDGNVCPWVDISRGVDVTLQILDKLKLDEPDRSF